jgi:hypothetical protein
LTKHKGPIENREGLVALVPLARRGGFGVIVVARYQQERKRGPRRILGYGFGPRLASASLSLSSTNLRSSDFDLIEWTSDMHLLDNRWIPLGRVQSFARDAWPVPPFKRWSRNAGSFVRVDYDPNTLLAIERDRPRISDEAAANLPWDGVSGSGAFEYSLDDAIEAKERGVPYIPLEPDMPPPSRVLPARHDRWPSF